MKRVVWFLPLFLFACQGNKTEKSKKDSTIPAKSTVNATPVDSIWNPFCQLLAGDSENLTQQTHLNPIWSEFSSTSQAKWDKLKRNIAQPIASWTNSQKALTNPVRTVLYPFAGGDFFYPHLFYPNADTIIMIGLEPAGFLFDPNTADSTLLTEYLRNLEKSLFFPHQLGFFRTKSMAVDFKKGYLNGTIHTCLYYLAKFGNQIHYIQSFDINDSGKITKIQPISTKPHNQKGIKIGYSSNNGTIKELIYFSEDLSDLGLNQKNKRIGSALYLASKTNSAAFFKAATYLMHKDYFSIIRNICLKNCNTILQDDSGIPLKELENNGFSVAVLGEYKRTIPLFSNMFQSDLKAKYDEIKPAKLPFNIGYNAQYKECNLQLAQKK
jgi:hypothetical protein